MASGQTTVEYAPVAAATLDGRPIARLLLVGGESTPPVAATETRRATPPDAVLPNGVYTFPGANGADVMVVERGRQPSEPVRAPLETLNTDHPLVAARGWFKFFWESATPVGPPARFAVGDFVRVLGSSSIVRVEEVVRLGDETMYVVTLNGMRRTMTEAGVAPAHLSPDDPLTWVETPAPSAKQFGVGLTTMKLTHPLSDTVYSYLSSKTVFRSYQFRPVLRLIGSEHQRMLIADEVGLGKTIEAGLIWNELEARNPHLDRVLIVCPAMLVHKWRDEMSRRFDRDLEPLDRVRLEDWVKRLAADDSSRPFVGVVSIERLRSAPQLHAINDQRPRFDLVIVDEAHYLRNQGTRSYDMGDLLADWADALIFLSATPLNLGNRDLFNLLNLLSPADFPDMDVFERQVQPNRFLTDAARKLLDHRDDPSALLPALERIEGLPLGGAVTRRPEFERLVELCSAGQPLDWRDIAEAKRLLLELNTLSSVLTRTRKVDLPEAKAVREPVQIDVVWTAEEQALYHAIVRTARNRAKANGYPPGFATQMPVRQAASCLPAMVGYLRENGWIGWRDDTDVSDDSLLEPDEVDDERTTHEVLLDEAVEELAELARHVTIDTKFERFAEKLAELGAHDGRQVLVFSFFRRTLEYLYDRLIALGFRARVMHGGVPVAERQHLMDEFRAGSIDVLLSSEVGAEGLDFEFCNVVVNYDLPWNPMRVEQRIGRLDRFGQQHEKIFVLNFQVPGTIESEIFERLYRRIDVFRSSIGDLEPILRNDFVTAARVALDPQLSDEQRQQRMDEIAVGLERRRSELQELDEARSFLSGLDGLLVDGFEADTKSKGRFIGPEELRELVVQFMGGVTSAKLLPSRSDAETELLVGDEVLADRVDRVRNQRGGSIYSAGELSRLLRDEEPIEVTFSNEEASRRGVELISIRHPLVRAAVRHFAAQPHGMHRFASVELEDMPRSGSWLVALHLVETTGVRPSLELWPTAMDLDTGEFDDDVGFALLAALTEGALLDGPVVDPATVAKPLRDVESHVHRLHARIEAERRHRNSALAEMRIASTRASFEFKIAKARETSAKTEGKRVQKIHVSRIRNLTLQMEEALERLESRRDLSMSMRLEALAVVRGSEGSAS